MDILFALNITKKLVFMTQNLIQNPKTLLQNQTLPNIPQSLTKTYKSHNLTELQKPQNFTIL